MAIAKEWDKDRTGQGEKMNSAALLANAWWSIQMNSCRKGATKFTNGSFQQANQVLRCHIVCGFVGNILIFGYKVYNFYFFPVSSFWFDFFFFACRWRLEVYILVNAICKGSGTNDWRNALKPNASDFKFEK